MGIKKTITTPGHLHSDGQIERMKRSLIDLLVKAGKENPFEWDQHLPYVMAAYRSTPHSTTGEIPNKMMWGRELTNFFQLHLLFLVLKIKIHG